MKSPYPVNQLHLEPKKEQKKREKALKKKDAKRQQTLGIVSFVFLLAVGILQKLAFDKGEKKG